MAWKSAHTNRGLTLLEVLVALSLLLIFSGLVFSTWHRVITKARLHHAVYCLVSAIRLARNTAIMTGGRIILCSSRDGKMCQGRWSDGQLVLQAKPRQVLRYFNHCTQHIDVQWRGSLSGDNHKVIFTESGFTAGQQGSFYLLPIHGDGHGERIVVMRSGRLRVEVYSGNSFSGNCKGATV